MNCGCSDQLTLWKTVENLVDNSTKIEQSFPPHAPPFKVKDIYFLPEMLDGLVKANDYLGARLNALEMLLTDLLGVLDSPLPRAERIERVIAIRRGMNSECRVCGAPCISGHGRCDDCGGSGREVPWRQ